MYISTEITLSLRPTGEYTFPINALGYTLAIGYWNGPEFVELTRVKREISNVDTAALMASQPEPGLPRGADLVAAILTQHMADTGLQGTLVLQDPEPT